MGAIASSDAATVPSGRRPTDAEYATYGRFVGAVPVTFQELPLNSDAVGVGALLMTDPLLPRDTFGHPYQPLFYFDQDSRPIGLVVDADGHVVAWENNAQGRPDLSDEWRCQRVPAEIEQAARDWWSHQRRT